MSDFQISWAIQAAKITEERKKYWKLTENEKNENGKKNSDTHRQKSWEAWKKAIQIYCKWFLLPFSVWFLWVFLISAFHQIFFIHIFFPLKRNDWCICFVSTIIQNHIFGLSLVKRAATCAYLNFIYKILFFLYYMQQNKRQKW